LYAFKNKFDEAVGSIAGDFPTNYKALDRTYAERLGIPFSENGVLSVDRARFVESVVPNLTTKPSAIKQILAATDNSPETLKVIEDAFLMKLSNSAGILNPDTMQVNVPKLNLFVKQNAEAIDTVPGLRQRLEQIGSNVQALKDTRATVLEEQKNASIDRLNTVWQKSQNTSGGFEGFVNSALKKPEQLQELLLLAGTDKTLQRGLKSSILDIGLNDPKKMEFFDANSKAIDTLFGKQHSERIKALFEASERLAKFPVSSKINPSLSQRTAFEGATGSRIEQVAGDIRNPILSTFRTFGNILSRYVQNKATKSESAEIQEFLSDPNTSKAATDFYDLVKNSQEAVNAVNRMKKEGRVEELKDFISDEENIKLMAVAPSLRRIQDQMAQVRSQINILKRDYEGDPEERREKINRLQKLYDQVARQGYKVMESAGVSR